jgi:hypothetical protein
MNKILSQHLTQKNHSSASHLEMIKREWVDEQNSISTLHKKNHSSASHCIQNCYSLVHFISLLFGFFGSTAPFAF